MAYSYYKALRDIETQKTLKRSRIESQLAEQALRRSRLQNKFIEQTLIDKKILNGSLNNISQITKVQKINLRKQKIQNDIQINRLERQTALRISRLESQMRSEYFNKKIQKSRLQAELQSARINSNFKIQNVFGRSKFQTNINDLLGQY